MSYLKKEKINKEVNVLYDENNITIEKGNIKQILCNEGCSQPSLNFSKDKLVYITPLEWEEIGKLMLYDVKRDTLTELKIDDIPSQYTIKKVSWIGEDKLIMIIGFAYGTVSVGGDLYTYDLNRRILKKIYKCINIEEVKAFNLQKNSLELEIAVFDEDFNSYSIKNETLQGGIGGEF